MQLGLKKQDLPKDQWITDETVCYAVRCRPRVCVHASLPSSLTTTLAIPPSPGPPIPFCCAQAGGEGDGRGERVRAPSIELYNFKNSSNCFRSPSFARPSNHGAVTPTTGPCVAASRPPGPHPPPHALKRIHAHTYCTHLHKSIHHMSVCFYVGRTKKAPLCNLLRRPVALDVCRGMFPYMSSLKPSWTSTHGPPAMMPTPTPFADWYTASDSAPGCSQMFVTPALACGEGGAGCEGRECRKSEGMTL